VRFRAIALGDCIEFVRDVTGISIVIDPAGLKAAGADTNTPVTLHGLGLSARTVLGEITKTVGKGEEKLQTRAIGSVVFVSSAARLDEIARQEEADALKAGNGDPAKLNQVLPEIRFDRTPAGDAIDFLRDVSGSNIFVPWRDLEVAGITQKTPVSLKLRDVPKRQVLRVLLNELEAGAKVKLDFTVAPNGLITIAPGAKSGQAAATPPSYACEPLRSVRILAN
jgi:hypothetical protein